MYRIYICKHCDVTPCFFVASEDVGLSQKLRCPLTGSECGWEDIEEEKAKDMAVKMLLSALSVQAEVLKDRAFELVELINELEEMFGGG